MGPNGSLSEWQVKVMINEAISAYDGINSRRHEEHTKKLDKLLWAVMGTLAAVSGGLVMEIIRYLMGR